MSDSFDFAEFEPRWQRRWDEERCFRAANPGEPGSERPPYYVLDFFPYPSGAGLHVGHPLGYIATDIVARFRRMRGFNVLHPMGWDAFGLPAEQYAIETGVHPAITTRRNIDTYTRQLKQIGLSYDWSRELATCTPDYYRWTQWIFLQIYNAWYDDNHVWTDAAGRTVRGAARPIDKLPVPPEVRQRGPQAVADFQDAHRLAYLAEVPVNWCPALGTVLSNEEVTNEGRSERGNHPVFKRPMKQWMLRITEYADRLLTDLDALDWPVPIKEQQRNWIGRSEGAYVDFRLDGRDDVIRVFTTRPDTLFGATYLVLAPEHRLVPAVTTPAQHDAVIAYVEQARQKSERDRAADTRVKTGVFTGGYAINPANHERLPIWVADYVLGGYGTGSIMAVPGSDRRDLEFAETFGLPVVQVVAPPPGYKPAEGVAAEIAWRGYEDDGVAVNSPPAAGERFADQCDLNGMATADAKRRMIDWLEARDLGEGTVQFKLRDWLFSRQRYWGEPFPILHTEEGRVLAVAESELPVTLPIVEDFRPHASDDPNAEPATPLSRVPSWIRVQRDDQSLRREANTMPQWAGSCWYYLRFIDPKNELAFADPAAEKYWLAGARADGSSKHGGVDLYVGGAEHAVLHLLYARFWHKALYDLGHVTTPEPFEKLFNQGMIGAAAYRDERGVYVPADEVTEGPPAEMNHPVLMDERARQQAIAGGASPAEAQKAARLRVTTTFSHKGRPVIQAFEKMSKSLKNVVNPDQIIADYGADTLRLYEMFMGPLEAPKPWNTRAIEGPHDFLKRIWRLVIAPADAAPGWRIHERVTADRNAALELPLHKTIEKVTADILSFSFNTAIAKMMEFVNAAYKETTIGRDQVERLLQLLAPFAPHTAEELWSRLGHAHLLARADWPRFDPALLLEERIEVAVRINNKPSAKLMVPVSASDADVAAAAMANERVLADLAGRSLRQPPRLGRSPKGATLNLIV